MHIYVLARGLLNSIREWEHFMKAQYMPFEWEDEKGKLVTGAAQVQVREVKLYEVIVPKDCEATAMGLIQPANDKGFGGKIVKWARRLIRLLGLRQSKVEYRNNPLVPKEGMSTMVLGIKNDKLNWSKKKSNDLIVRGGKPQEQL